MELSEQIGSDTNETSDRTLIVQSSSTCVENSNCGFDGDKNNNAELSSSFTSIRKSIDRSKSSDSSDNTALNFSVDRILKSSSSKTDTNLDDSKKINFETNLLRNAVPDDDFGKLYRPMPVRYMPNSTPFAGICGFLWFALFLCRRTNTGISILTFGETNSFCAHTISVYHFYFIL